MKVAGQGLQAFFVHKISKLGQGIGEDKEEKDGHCDDGDFDPFHSCDKGNGQEENVA